MEAMNEIWKDIQGYEGMYQVSNLGRVRSLDREIVIPHPRNPSYTLRYMKMGDIKSQRCNNKGYYEVDLFKNNIQDTRTVHRLVATAFLPNPNNLPEVNHINENHQDNKLENLEWVTRLQNIRHGTGRKRMGRAHWTPVEQYTLDGTFIKRWECMQQAADELHLHMTHISAVCRGRARTHGGYLWKYPKE